MRKSLAIAIGMGFVLMSGTALGQEFGDKKTLAFSADRLFGLYLTHETLEGPGGDWDSTNFGLLWQGLSASKYGIARGSIDYFVIDHLSLGGSLGISTNDSQTNFLLAPRIGGAWMFSDVVGLWPRGGFTYLSESDHDWHTSRFALTLEAALILSPTEHFAFTLGPAFDVGIGGSRHVDGPAPDLGLRTNSFGIVVGGVMGWANL